MFVFESESHVVLDGLEFIDPPASVSEVLRSKTCTIITPVKIATFILTISET